MLPSLSLEKKAQIDLNFNKGLSYRVLVCADEYLEGLNYSISDKATNQLYHSDTLKDVSSVMDLKVKQSGPLTLNINVPKPAKKNATGIVRSGCVTILVGFKE